jgi:hypothetical protein
VATSSAKLLLLAVSIGALVTHACKEKSVCTKEGVHTVIVGNHGHSLELAPEDIERGAGKRFAITGGTHKHSVALRTTALDELKAGKAVDTRASSANAHTHEIAIHCGAK